LPYWGWGDIPDQYRRRFDGDDGETPIPRSPGLEDLPPILPWWGKNPSLSGQHQTRPDRPPNALSSTMIEDRRSSGSRKPNGYDIPQWYWLSRTGLASQ
jgi:hypothetical protein